MNNSIEFDYDLALETIDYSFPNYTPSSDSLEFFALMRIVNGGDFEVNTPMAHYFMIDVVFGNVTDPKQFPYSEEVQKQLDINLDRIGIIASRGLAKSTVITAFLPVYCAIKGEIPNRGKIYFNLILAASTQSGARVISKSIKALCDESRFCNEYFEEMRFTETECEFVRNGDSKRASRTFLVRLQGVGTAIRGVRDHAGRRPCFISFDDVIADTSAAYSETQMHNLEDAMLSDATNALKANGGFTISVATPFHRGDPVCKPIINRSVTPVLLPICTYIDENTTEEEFNGAWPEMHSFNSVKSQYINAKKNNKLSSFNLERMLQMSNEEDRLVTDDMFQWYDRNLITKMIDGYSLYMTTDFTTTSAAKSDFSAICLWAVSSNNDYFLLDICLRRQELQQQYDEVFRMISQWGKYKHIEVGVEIDGQQKAHLFSLKQLMQKKGLYFSFAKQKGAPVSREGILSKVGASSKHERFRYIVPMFQNKKFYFPEQLKDTPEMKEAIKQLKGATMTGFSAKDDFCDGVSQLGMIDAIPGSGVMREEEFNDKSSGVWLDWDTDEETSNGSTVF